MDPAQSAQMIAWLDDEQRKGKAQIAELRELVQKQAIELGDQRKRIEDLQGRLTRLQTELARTAQIDAAIQQLKSELASVLHDVREELRRNEQQALQTRQLERESDAKAVLELGQRVEQLSTLQDKLAAIAAEQQRLNEALTAQRQRTDSIDKDLLRRTDQDRIEEEERKRLLARLDAMQQALDSMRTQADSYNGRFQVLERWAQGSAQRTADLQAFRADMQRIQAELLETQRRSEQRIEKQLREWATVSEAIHRDHEAWGNQLRPFAEQHERTKKALAAIQDLAKELRVAQDEARQNLDLSIEKQRREFREWQGENEKRWTRYLAQWEYRWTEQRKLDETLISRIEDLEAANVPIRQELQELKSLLAEEAAQARQAVLELWQWQLDLAQQEMDRARAQFDKTRGRVGQ